MPDRWFRVPEVGSGTTADPLRPKYSDRVDAHTGNTIGAAPGWVVRYYADTATLDGIAAEADATEISPTQALALFNTAAVPHLEGTRRPWPDTQELHRRFQVI